MGKLISTVITLLAIYTVLSFTFFAGGILIVGTLIFIVWLKPLSEKDKQDVRREVAWERLMFESTHAVQEYWMWERHKDKFPEPSARVKELYWDYEFNDKRHGFSQNDLDEWIKNNPTVFSGMFLSPYSRLRKYFSALSSRAQ